MIELQIHVRLEDNVAEYGNDKNGPQDIRTHRRSFLSTVYEKEPPDMGDSQFRGSAHHR